MRVSVHPSASGLLLHCTALLYSLCVCANNMPVQMKTNSHVEKNSVLQTENQEKSLQINDTF